MQISIIIKATENDDHTDADDLYDTYWFLSMSSTDCSVYVTLHRIHFFVFQRCIKTNTLGCTGFAFT